MYITLVRCLWEPSKYFLVKNDVARLRGCQKLSKTQNIFKRDQQHVITTESDGDLLKIWRRKNWRENPENEVFPTFTATLRIKVFIKRKLVLNFSWKHQVLSKLNTRIFVWNLESLQKPCKELPFQDFEIISNFF